MNHDKKSNSTHSKTKVQWWRKLIVWGFIFTIGIYIIGCKKENNIDPNEYYVKYEVSSTTIYSGGKLDVTLNSEINETMTITINQRTAWEIVIGPVQKGFNATMKVVATGETNDKLKLYTNIYVSKNDSPFALKKSDGSDIPADSVDISYTIDY